MQQELMSSFFPRALVEELASIHNQTGSVFLLCKLWTGEFSQSKWANTETKSWQQSQNIDMMGHVGKTLVRKNKDFLTGGHTLENQWSNKLGMKF